MSPAEVTNAAASNFPAPYRGTLGAIFWVCGSADAFRGVVEERGARFGSIIRGVTGPRPSEAGSLARNGDPQHQTPGPSSYADWKSLFSIGGYSGRELGGGSLGNIRPGCAVSWGSGCGWISRREGRYQSG